MMKISVYTPKQLNKFQKRNAKGSTPSHIIVNLLNTKGETLEISKRRTSLAVQWYAVQQDSTLSLPRAQVQSLIREPRSRKSCGMAEREISKRELKTHLKCSKNKTKQNPVNQNSYIQQNSFFFFFAGHTACGILVP